MQFSLGQILQALMIAFVIGIATFVIDLYKSSIVNDMRLSFVEKQLTNCVSNDVYQVEKMERMRK
jgi:flagellar biosynthesis protein FliP